MFLPLQLIVDRAQFYFHSGYITISGGGDSYYEYLLKTHLLMGGQEAVQLDMWKQSIKSMQKFLRSETDRNLVFLGELNDEYKLLQTGELVIPNIERQS